MKSRLVVLIVAIGGIVGCGGSATTAVRSAASLDRDLLPGTELVQAVASLQSDYNRFEKSVNHALGRFHATQKEGALNSKKLSDLAMNWGTDWNEVHRAKESLAASWSSLAYKERQFWDQVEKNNKSIDSDDRLRKRDLDANNARKAEWTRKRYAAGVRVAQAAKIEKQGWNLHVALKNSVLRGQLVECMDVLTELARDTADIRRDLNILSEEICLLEGLLTK